MKEIACHFCGFKWSYEPPLGRREECPQCHRDAHICLNCIFYDPMAHRECREPNVEWVKDKERSNFCDEFVASDRSTHQAKQGDQAKAALESLFSQNKQQQEKSTRSPKLSLEEELKAFLNKKS